ncbi:hypothetical protein FEM48_Zijuj09G0180800 [Ziziphus jujuba var. spinosa]|uniref:SCP domain-containing protein n=1 Tax=Ziziphus jujuba var. spinosa TaxID=714518 RepID=A0A978UUH4_ZIZJJ|nr:hypothetical protein FEM48_Zijuj09G0180800 [Ziziphus jujuba var. spinosa]
MGSSAKCLVAMSMCMVLITQITHVHSRKLINPHQDFVDAHNAARAEVGVGPITWNNTVAAYAKRYAEQRRKDCSMVHSGGPYGENLALGYRFMSGGDAVRMWVSEKSDYNYATNSCAGDDCLHYTQVVWRNSTRLGCARVKCDNGWMFVICSYDPPGNYFGQLPY